MSRTLTGADGNRLVATEMGAGPRTVLLLHGGGQTRHAWGRTARRLAGAGWRAVALDQRGHGDSAWIESGAYGFSDFARDVEAVARRLAAEHGREPVAIGASLGGMAALLAQGAAPVLDGLVLVDIVPRMDPRGVAHIQGFMRARADEGFGSIEEAAAAVSAYLPHRPRPASLDGLRKNLRLHADGRWRWHWDPRFLDGPRAPDGDAIEPRALQAVRSLAIPALLVRGGSSELVTPEAAAEFRALAPHAEYADVAGARHMVAGDRNDVFGDAVLSFLATRFGEAEREGPGRALGA
jgi:pimeloyl-ACP methyl ester carboxylesterase